MSVATRSQHRIPNWRLRREFQRRVELGWIDPGGVALRMGWGKDASRVYRELGITEWADGRGGGPQRKISFDIAVRLCDAIGVDPYEVGL